MGHLKGCCLPWAVQYLWCIRDKSGSVVLCLLHFADWNGFPSSTSFPVYSIKVQDQCFVYLIKFKELRIPIKAVRQTLIVKTLSVVTRWCRNWVASRKSLESVSPSHNGLCSHYFGELPDTRVGNNPYWYTTCKLNCLSKRVLTFKHSRSTAGARFSTS